MVEKARAAGIDVAVSSVVSAVEGNLGVTAVRVAAYRKGQGRVITERKIACDFIAMSGGFNPALHLWCHNGGKIKFDDGLQSFRPDRHQDPITRGRRRQWHLWRWPTSLPKPRRPARRSQSGKTKAAKVKLPKAEQDAQKPLEAHLVCTGHGQI